MNEFNKRNLLLVAVLGTLLGSGAAAADDSYFYGGLGLGQSRARIDVNRITSELLSSGLAATDITRHEDRFAYKVFGGYQFNRYVALEGGYFNLGRVGYTATTVPPGWLTGTMRTQGINLDVVGTLPLSKRLSVIARGGAQFADVNDNFYGSGAVVVLNPEPSSRKIGYKFGTGLQYEVSRSLFVRAEAERYRINDAVGNHGDINAFSVSLIFPIGRSTSAPPPPPTAYVAPTPEPAAIVRPPPPPPPPSAPVRRRVSFQADSLFTFDHANLSSKGKMALDKFAGELAGARYQMITVEGYTDRLGSAAYNQRLSLRRAEAVKAYLVESGRIDAAKISAVGNGASDPVTKPGECRGTKRSPRLIACLQPDRRVEIAVDATQ